MHSLDILDRLIGFPSVSRDSNREIVAFIETFLAQRGIQSELILAEEGRKANLLAAIGPGDRPAILLSGHTDVVPTDGQAWSTDPFRLARRDGKAYGRGAADMKGYLASCLRLADLASRQRLAAPLILCFSHDEEVGCIGVRSAITRLAADRRDIRLAIVGEPTSMRIATGHKGKIAARAVCRGREGHSSRAPDALNAVHLACDFIGLLRQKQAALAAGGDGDLAYDVPYTTIHAGRIDGGTALNIVPNACMVDFEIRSLPEDDAGAILAELADGAGAIAAREQARFPEARITVEILNQYPGLAIPDGSEAVAFVQGLIENPSTCKVAFGTEAGLFAVRLGIPAIVCGPGSIEQAHKPDEYLSFDQLDACDRMMDRLLARLVA